MKDWKKFVFGKKQEVKLDDSISELIIKQFGCRLINFFKHTDGNKTKLIKAALALLGDKELEIKPHYKVYANRLPSGLRRSDGGKFKPTEWLYDLHWFTDPGGYRLTSVPLVVECEWRWTRTEEKVEPGEKKDFYGAVKYDFQKLLVTNAKLRLLVFIKRPDSPNEKVGETVNDKLDEYFENVIKNYDRLADDSKFLFVAFDKNIAPGAKGFHYFEKHN